MLLHTLFYDILIWSRWRRRYSSSDNFCLCNVLASYWFFECSVRWMHGWMGINPTKKMRWYLVQLSLKLNRIVFSLYGAAYFVKYWTCVLFIAKYVHVFLKNKIERNNPKAKDINILTLLEWIVVVVAPSLENCAHKDICL